MKNRLVSLAIACTTIIALDALATDAPGSFPMHWNEGAQNCAKEPPPPIEAHAYDPDTFILRESLCATFEGNFIYLLAGTSRSLLIDTGAVADLEQMPLARTVMDLLAIAGAADRPLLVVHTHRHQDHRAGDGQFKGLPKVTVVGYDLPSVKQYFGFAAWPDGLAQIDLGNRIVDVIPTPGHQETHVSFYDRNTALFFSGDFMMRGRLIIGDAAADLASARRVAGFLRDHPVKYVLGGHIEQARSGELFPSGSTYHPDEHPLQMDQADLLALPPALEHFNGFYTRQGQFTFINAIRILIAAVTVALVVLSLSAVWLIRYRRRRPAIRFEGGR